LGGGNHAADRIDIDGKLLPLFADTSIHSDNNPFGTSRIQAMMQSCPADRLDTLENTDMQVKTPYQALCGRLMPIGKACRTAGFWSPGLGCACGCGRFPGGVNHLAMIAWQAFRSRGNLLDLDGKTLYELGFIATSVRSGQMPLPFVPIINPHQWIGRQSERSSGRYPQDKYT
jgi:hypothetical protein